MQQTVHHNPNRGTTSADVPALCRREGHAAPGRVQHHHRQQYHAVHLEEGSKGEGGEAAPAQSLHGGQHNRVQGTPSNLSTSKYYGLANNHCSIAGDG